MTSLWKRQRTQKAVYYAVSSQKSDYAEAVLVAGVEVLVRWEERLEEITDPFGKPIVSQIRLVVDRVVALGSIFWKGALEDLPSPVTDLFQVVAYSEVPDVKGRTSRKVARLIRYGNELPTIES